jgi:hypothetical protein
MSFSVRPTNSMPVRVSFLSRAETNPDPGNVVMASIAAETKESERWYMTKSFLTLLCSNSGRKTSCPSQGRYASAGL